MFLVDVGLKAGAPICDGQLNSHVDVDDDGAEQEEANGPKKWPEIAQMLRVAVNPVRPEKNL